MKKLTALFTSLMLCAAVTGCDVDVEGETRLPEVEVEGGEVPDVEVRGPDVDVGTEKVEVTVPDVDVDIPQENEAVIDAETDDGEKNDQ